MIDIDEVRIVADLSVQDLVGWRPDVNRRVRVPPAERVRVPSLTKHNDGLAKILS